MDGFEEDFVCVYGKTGRNQRTKVRKLIKLGVPKEKAYEWGNTRKGYWRISNSPILHRTLGNSYWSNQGLKSLQTRYETLASIILIEPPYTRTVRTVV